MVRLIMSVADCLLNKPHLAILIMNTTITKLRNYSFRLGKW